MQGIVTGGKHHGKKTVFNPAECSEAPFAIILAGVFHDQGMLPIEVFDHSERQTAFLDISGILGGIKSQSYEVIV